MQSFSVVAVAKDMPMIMSNDGTDTGGGRAWHVCVGILHYYGRLDLLRFSFIHESHGLSM